MARKSRALDRQGPWWSPIVRVALTKAENPVVVSTAVSLVLTSSSIPYSRPGLENLGADAVVAGGINMNPDMPEGMEFIPSSVPDGEIEFNVPSTSDGTAMDIEVKPVCMTFEDYYAGFSADSFPGFSVSPATGRMDRRGGEPTLLTIKVVPQGASGDLVGNLVVNLPEDNSKICYVIKVKSF